jgi:hypothetical protein
MTSFFNFDTQLLLQAFGIIFIGLGVVVRLGTWKKWYWRSKTTIYSYIPIGLIFLLVSVQDLAKEQLGTNYWIYQACYAIPVALAIWWVARTPAFIKPAWVRWIEAYPPKIYQAMQEDALADAEWERHVTSQKEVEIWAKSLERRKPKPTKTGK